MLRFSGMLALGLAFTLASSLSGEEPSEATSPASVESPSPTSEEPAPAADSAQGEKESAPRELVADSDAPPDKSAKYDLKYKFTAGEVVRTEVIHRATVQSTIDGSTQRAETQSKSIKA